VATAASVRADVLLSQSSSHLRNESFLVVAAALAEATVVALRREFAPDPLAGKTGYMICDSPVSVVTLVGQNLDAESGMVARTLAALGQENLNIIATVQGSRDCSMSFVVPQRHVQLALASLHRELGLGVHASNGHRIAPVASPSAIWNCAVEPAAAD